ncbi:MAG: hypothetical protein E7432_00125 [Ruminococcaceae bacterium]|nr:hypothetical protein [Oscillospiraceae bacterium]
MDNKAVLTEIVPTNAILMELFTYALFSLVLILLMDWYAAKKIGGRDKMGYKVLSMPRHISLYLIYGFTLVIALLCMYTDFTVTRGTLSYFGIPYFMGLTYYLMQMLRRVKSETKGGNQPQTAVKNTPKKKKKKK